jgi:hypothetical protein
LRNSGGSVWDKIAREILSYFLRNPRAADSFEGVARWRLSEEIARRSVVGTEDAMRWLVENQYLSEEKIPGGKIIYRLNMRRREDAERLVGGTAEEPPGPSEDST